MSDGRLEGDGVRASSHQALANTASILFLACLIAFTVRSFWISLWLPWFLSSDEYVVVGEVIRFAQLDFHQQFTDMPGTPFMLIGAAAWRGFYEVLQRVTLVIGSVWPFTFRHLQGLFTLVRAETLLFYCLSLVLLFWLTSRIANRASAFVATLLLAMSPTYALYSSFVRVESLAVCLMLAALLCVATADSVPGQEPGGPGAGWPRTPLICLAGVLIGLSGATRLHAITASLPVTVLLVVSKRERPGDNDPRWRKVLNVIAVAATVAAGLLLFALRSRLSAFPHARSLMLEGLLVWAVALLVCNALYWPRRTRAILGRLVTADVVRLLAGCAVGFTLAMVPVLIQFTSLLASIEMYSTRYSDLNRVALPLLENVRWYLRHYVDVIAPGTIWFVFLAAGAILILVRRERRALSILTGAVLFFLSKPLNLIAAPHHVIPWLPLYSIVCAYPVAVASDLVKSRSYSSWMVPAMTSIVLMALCASITLGPAVVSASAAAANERLHNVGQATAWIKSNAEPRASVAIAYHCFNPDVFYAWMRSSGVPVPDAVLDGRDYIIWWGQKSVLKGKSGYACASAEDVAWLKNGVDALTPGEGTDPFADGRFTAVRSFGTAASQVTIFRFGYQ